MHQDTSTGTVLARAVWWAPPTGDHPVALDCLWVHATVEDPFELATQLLEHRHTALLEAGMPHLPEYLLDVPVAWRDDPAARDAVTWRVTADTDTTNQPMAAAFTRAGYHVTQRRLAMAPPLT